MEIFAKWLLLASVNLAAVMSPGPAFAMTVRNSIAYNRRVGFFTALGLSAGVGVLVALVLGGFAVILTQSALLYNLIRYAGAAYLLYIGVKALFAKKHAAAELENGAPLPEKSLSDFSAFRMGFLTSVSNPKGIVFFTAVYTQFVDLHTSWQILFLYWITAVILEFGWFASISFVLTNARIKRRFIGFAHWIERVCGGLLIALGIRLAMSKGLS